MAEKLNTMELSDATWATFQLGANACLKLSEGIDENCPHKIHEARREIELAAQILEWQVSQLMELSRPFADGKEADS